MDFEADDQLANVYAKMDAKTGSFLSEFKPKLDTLFSKQLGSVYLEKMEEHLETFYKDVNDELEVKRDDMNNKVDELLSEAQSLKHALRDTSFEVFLNEDNQMSLMDYKDKLYKDLIELRELYEKKKIIIDECLLEQKRLCEELDKEPHVLSSDPLATEVEISEFMMYLSDLQHEKFRRLNEISSLQQAVQDLCNEMEISYTLMSEVKPTEENISRLKSEVAEYEKQRKTIKEDCDRLVDKLEFLWEYLNAPKHVRERFREIAHKYTETSVDKLNNEFRECKNMKQEHIKEVIVTMREKIVLQWDKIYKSELERRRFDELFESTLYNDDLLKLHEIEYEECKDKIPNRNVKVPLFVVCPFKRCR